MIKNILKINCIKQDYFRILAYILWKQYYLILIIIDFV